MTQTKVFTFSPYAENTYVFSDETKQCVIIDPGCYDLGERQLLNQYIEAEDLKPAMVLNTHCHIDHIFGNKYLVGHYDIPLLAPEDELYNLEGATAYALMTGLNLEASPNPDTYLIAGETVEFGNTTLEIIFTPGHSAGHVSFFHREEKLLFSGDVLFQGSIGRTDLPGGSFEVLMETLRNKILPLGDEVKVYAGHMGETTIGIEKEHNPFILQYV